MYKLNNNGFGMAMLVAFIGIFLLAIIMIALLTNHTRMAPGNNDGIDSPTPADTSVYKNYELSASEAATIYYEKSAIGIVDGESMIVSIKKLSLSSKILEDCTGYVKIDNKLDNINYSPYLKCGSYTTNGYSTALDN